MSKLTALITTLVLGSSTVAMAQPTISYRADRSDRSWFDRDDDREVRRHRFDDRYDRNRREIRDDFGPRRYRSAWVALSTAMQLDGEWGRFDDRDRDTIQVRDRGTFTQLRLQTTAGASMIDRVIIHFADGSRQVANLGRVLNPRSPMVEIALDGNNRRVEAITVTGQSRRNGTIQVFGI